MNHSNGERYRTDTAIPICMQYSCVSKNCAAPTGRLTMNLETTLPDSNATGDNRPIYVRLADELSELVESGQLKAGDRLPSVRRLVAQKGVSASTAVAALRALE